jgi:hypothetical protein
MAKHVRADGIVTGSQQPYTKTTHEWYNSMITESSLASIGGYLPNYWLTGKLVILSGCVLSGTDPGVRSITAGWVFYNGEAYKVDAGNFTTTGVEVGVWSIVETNTPLTFSDNTVKSVHQEKKFRITNGTTGSGLFDENSPDVIRHGEWMIGQFSDVFSSFDAGGDATLDLTGTKITYRVTKGSFEYKLILSVTVDNATNINDGSNMGLEISAVPNAEFQSLYSNNENGDTGICSVIGPQAIGGCGQRFDSGAFTVYMFISNRNVVNGNNIKIFISGSWPLATS